MRDRTRNVIVGLTMLGALGVCMYGIVLLGKFPGVGISQYGLALTAADAAGITSGAKVELNGIVVGSSKAPYLFKDPNGTLTVRLDLLIDGAVDIPAGATATLARPTTGVGQSFVKLEFKGAPGSSLPKDGSATLHANVGDAGLIPQPVIDAFQNTLKNQLDPAVEKIGIAASQLTVVGKDLHTLLAYATPEAIEAADPNDPNRPVANASTLIIRLERTTKSLQELLTDPKVHAQLRQTVQNLADASTQLKTLLTKAEGTVGNVDTVVAGAGKTLDAFTGAATQATTSLASAQKDITRVTDTLVSTLGTLDKSLRQIAEGQGTTGKLINDPRLYEGLVDLSKSLKSTVSDLDFLIKKWTDEGLPLKLGK